MIAWEGRRRVDFAGSRRLCFFSQHKWRQGVPRIIARKKQITQMDIDKRCCSSAKSGSVCEAGTC